MHLTYVGKVYALREDSVCPLADAVIKFWNAHWEQIYKQCLSKTKVPDAVWDIMQDLYIRVQTHSEELLSHENPEAWLILVAANLCKDYLRKERKRRTGLLCEKAWAWNGEIAPNKKSDPPKIEPILVDDVLRHFSEESQKILKMHFMSGYTVEELCKTFGMSKSAMAKRLASLVRRARKIANGGQR